VITPPDSAMTLWLVGTITSTFTADLFPPLVRPLTVVGAELNAGTAPVGCTTFPTINVWDNTAGASIANVVLTGASAQPMTITTALVPAGHVIAARVSVAPVGCSTNLQNPIINVLYH
jgi:hypothetical protein